MSELAAAGKLNTRLADIAGMKDLGANLAIEMFEVANLLESVEHAHPEAEREAVIEVLAALIALIWCSIWLAGWIQWAAVWGQPIREMDPYGLLGNAVLIGGGTRWAHGKSRQILGRSL